MGFEDRLKKAIQRGQHRSEAKLREEQAKKLTEDELRRMHSGYRLRLSEHIESCIRRLPQHFPGFQCETIYGERGWGAACSRDDLRIGPRGKRDNDYSRLEMTIRPFSDLHVLELAGKGTIRNKEVYNRKFFEKLVDVDVDKFEELVDAWVLEYAELYAARM
jgi:hypothetical protein